MVKVMYNDILVYRVVIWAFSELAYEIEKVALKPFGSYILWQSTHSTEQCPLRVPFI